MSETLTDEDFEKAWDSAARTADGHVIYLYLQKQLCAVTTADAQERALPRLEGRRSFAAELMALMAKGIDESGGRDSGRTTVVFARQQPSGGNKHVSAREYFRRQSEPASAD